MATVSEIYNEKAIEIFVGAANKKKISSYVQRAFEKCKAKLGDMTLEEFAAYTSGIIPNRSGIGEKSQFEVLEKKIPGLECLRNSGKEAVRFSKKNDRIVIVKGEKSTLGTIKSFDAIQETDNEVIFHIWKTVDIGDFSDSIGGGHQDNVRNELETLISFAKGHRLTYNGKRVSFAVLIDGRSSLSIIEHCKGVLGKCENIVISNSDEYMIN